MAWRLRWVSVGLGLWVLLLPLAVPVMIGSVEATRGALSGDPYSLYRNWVELLIVFDVIFTVVSFWLFDFIMDY